MKKFQLISIVLISSVLLSACFKTRAEVEEEEAKKEMQSTLHQNITAQSDDLQKVQAQLGYIQGKLEETQHNSKAETTQRIEAEEALSKRMMRIEEKFVALEQSQITILDELKKIRKNNLKKIKSRSSSRSSSRSKLKISHGSALSSFKKKRYSDVIKILSAYLKKYPNTKYFLSAHYHLGESHYRQKKYEQAILAFSEVHDRKFDSNFGRKSTLRIAQSFRKLGKKNDARAFAELLVERFPKSPEAKVAKAYQ